MHSHDLLPWPPLLDGELAERAWRAIDDIAAAVEALAETQAPRDPSLASGDAGLALLYGYLARAQPGRGHEERAEAALDRAFDGVAAAPIGAGLYGGYTGVAWAAWQLRGSVLDEADDTTEEVDTALLDVLASPPGGTYDLVDGLVGVGVYALERLPSPAGRTMLERVLGHLEARALPDADRAIWVTPGEGASGGYVDLGVAHGVAGVIALLGETCRAGVAPEKARALLAAAVDGLWERAMPAGGETRFPAIAPGEAGAEPTRSAWCYGDPGIAAALLVAARGAREPSWEEAARDLARLAAARPHENAGVVDAGLCHGAAGLGHVFHRLYRATGDAACAGAARDWLTRALDMRRPGEGVAGYRAFHPAYHWNDDISLLTGAAGIALCLLGAVAPVAPEWDRMLLVSVPPARSA